MRAWFQRMLSTLVTGLTLLAGAVPTTAGIAEISTSEDTTYAYDAGSVSILAGTGLKSDRGLQSKPPAPEPWVG